MRDENVAIRGMENPSHLSELVQASINNNLLWRLDELADERRELQFRNLYLCKFL
ncbi:MAG: hypothetical protein PVF82_09990 [Gammaproteobacteria bacterium]